VHKSKIMGEEGGGMELTEEEKLKSGQRFSLEP
jgi:hypothetical protein